MEALEGGEDSPTRVYTIYTLNKDSLACICILDEFTENKLTGIGYELIEVLL